MTWDDISSWFAKADWSYTLTAYDKAVMVSIAADMDQTGSGWDWNDDIAGWVDEQSGWLEGTANECFENLKARNLVRQHDHGWSIVI
jgi:hypothetical protein